MIPGLVLVLACGSCAADTSVDAAPAFAAESQPEAVTLLFAGDAMLGRSVAPIAAADPDGLFADIRREIRRADLAAVNIESPLTSRPHESPNPYALEADPAMAQLLADAGFDIAGLANNHAGDAGPASIVDSTVAVGDAGMVPVGGGDDLAAAWEPAVVDVSGVSVAFLAIDGSGQGLTATERGPGIASWDPDLARDAVHGARQRADVVTVGLHGGIEYWGGPDPLLIPIAEELASWGVDVVWGHGPHVEQPLIVIDPDGDGRPTVVATSLGNFLFDQTIGETSAGILLEVLVGRDGVVAHRVGDKHHDDLRVHFSGWRTPDGDAALVAGRLWSLDRGVMPVNTTIDIGTFTEGVVVDAARGDLSGDGIGEYLVSYRHPIRTGSNGSQPPPRVDSAGMSAHLGVLDETKAPIWLSRRPPHPVGMVAACDGAAAFAYTTLDDNDVVATGVGTWGGFGFVLEEELPGSGVIGCADVDGDGLLDPVVIDRDSAIP
ncbi:MAG: CapA family protein [Actinomycetota bacterium]|nr:CapA family protein [Actinomycetota bacterium]